MNVGNTADLSIYMALAVALACGLLIGLDRERTGTDDDFGGIRTYPLIGLVGALSQLIAPTTGNSSTGIAFTGLLGFMGIYYYQRSKRGEYGLTSEFALIATFLCGVLSMQGKMVLAFAIAIAITVILALKKALHRGVRNLMPDDINAILKFLVVAFVLLPLLPNKTYTMNVQAELLPFISLDTPSVTFDVINPRKVGWMVVLIASISFAGFLLSKLMVASKSLALTALVGGLASSTAVTLSFAGQARRKSVILNICVMAILVASTTMFIRIMIEVAAVAPALLPSVIKPIGAMALAGIIICVFFWFRRSADNNKEQEIKLTNPFELGEAFKFGAFFALVLLVAHAAQKLFGDEGLYISSLLAGLTDVDAITLSISDLTLRSTEPVSHRTATIAITLAALANTVVKGLLALITGGISLGFRVMMGFLIMAAAGLTALFAQL